MFKNLQPLFSGIRMALVARPNLFLVRPNADIKYMHTVFNTDL